MQSLTAPESIAIAALTHVFGGRMTAGELACRTTGATVGGLGGFALNLAAYRAHPDTTAMASAINLAAGLTNAATGSSMGESASDAVLAVAAAAPLIGSPIAAFSGGKFGWKAGGAACGYGWRSRR